MDKDIERMLYELYDVVKTPHDDVMILPFGNSSPEEVVNWLVNLSDEDFSLLMKTPIINQAKMFYTKVRKKVRGE
jgi:hypothetical protein